MGSHAAGSVFGGGPVPNHRAGVHGDLYSIRIRALPNHRPVHYQRTHRRLPPVAVARLAVRDKPGERVVLARGRLWYIGTDYSCLCDEPASRHGEVNFAGFVSDSGLARL